MLVKPFDGCCRSCGGPLDIIDADDVTLTVACSDCADTYPVEIEAFADSCLVYWPEVMAKNVKQEADNDA